MWMMGFRGNIVVKPLQVCEIWWFQAELDYSLIEGHRKNSELMAIYTTSTLAMEPEKGVPFD